MAALAGKARPRFVTPMRDLTPDLCIVGAGSGGLSLAAGAAQLGASTVLIERYKMGGDCLNYGCVPSKSLLAAANICHAARRAERFGLRSQGKPDYKKAQAHLRRVIAAIAPHDSAERFTRLGVRVIAAEARFVSPRVMQAGRHRIRARRFVLATGSRPFVPPIAGLMQTPYLTNETIFALRSPPRHLAIVGGGPIGCEMAQAHQRLGVPVSLFEAERLLPRDDDELVAPLRAALQRDGVKLFEGAKITQIRAHKAGVEIMRKGARPLRASHVLVATGRRPNLEALDLEKANIACTPQGVAVDARLRSTNRRVFAIGDAAGGAQFTHAASYQAGIVLRNILFRLPAKWQPQRVPHVTYTSPELAQLGPTEAALKKTGQLQEVVRKPFADNDRARAEAAAGCVKLCVGKRGRVLSVGIVGAGAGDLLLPWSLLLDKKMSLAALADQIVPYPSRSEASKHAASAYYAPRLFSPRGRQLVRLLRALP